MLLTLVRFVSAFWICSFYPEAKRIACREQTVPVLIDLLVARKAEIRAAAAGALMR